MMNSHRKMTPKGQMSGSGMGPAIAHLPFHLKSLFEPRPPLEYKPMIVKRKMPPYCGIADFVDQFEKTAPPKRIVNETPKERQERVKKEKMEKSSVKLKKDLEKWDPHKNELGTSDAYKTLFVGRLSYDVTESQLKREFDQYGSIKTIRIVEDKDGKSRGYAFVEFVQEEDMKAAYKHADGKKIDGRRIVVDVERGRTVRDWKPRKFGGGIGDTRKGGQNESVRYSGRIPISNMPRGSDSYRGDSRRGDPSVGSKRRYDEYRGGNDYRDRGPRRDFRERGRDRSRSRDRRNSDRGDRYRGRAYDRRDYDRRDRRY